MNFLIFIDINFFSIFIPPVFLNSFLVVIAVAVIFIFFSKRSKKLNKQIAELKNKRDELNELLDNAHLLNKNLMQESVEERNRTEFLMAKMNFEIHNCVNGIMGMTNLLKDTDLTPEQQTNTDIIISCSTKLLGAADESFNPDNSVNNAKINSVKNLKQKTVAETEREKISKDFFQKYPFTILVAEDDSINQQLTIKLLEKLGYTADLASNGKEALEMVSEKNYDVILMDVLMPEMDGFEATKMIRLCLDIQPIIIALTASAMAGDKEKCMQAGMNDYLCKPININELADLFAKWSEEKKLVS